MEVDNELDQTLLQQFSCMGTTDKDDLIKQLQKLVGNDLNTSAASFFLDMNNWNLQAAICSYFDFQSPFNLPSMVLVMDVTIGEGESVPPNTKFTKTWRVQNNGDEDWPAGCELQITDGDSFEAPPSVPVEALAAGAVTDISVDMVSPLQPGIYQTKWRMLTPTGSYFGDTIWVILTVAEGGTLAVTQQLSHLHELGSSPRSTSLLNPFHPTNQGTIVPQIHAIFQQEGQSQEEDSPMMLCTRTPPSGTS